MDIPDIEQTGVLLRNLQKEQRALGEKLTADEEAMKSPRILKVRYDKLAAKCDETKTRLELIPIIILEWRVHLLNMALAGAGLGWCSKHLANNYREGELVKSAGFSWIEYGWLGESRHHEGGRATQLSLKHLCHECSVQENSKITHWEEGWFASCISEVLDDRLTVLCAKAETRFLFSEAVSYRLFGIGSYPKFQPSEIFTDLWRKYGMQHENQLILPFADLKQEGR